MLEQQGLPEQHERRHAHAALAMLFGPSMATDSERSGDCHLGWLMCQFAGGDLHCSAPHVAAEPYLNCTSLLQGCCASL